MTRYRPDTRSSTSRRVALILGLLAILLASTPIEGLSSLVPATDGDTCCGEQPADDATDPSSAAEPPSGDDCCPSGCHGCFLKCCMGLLSLRPAPVLALPDVTSSAAVLEACRVPASAPRGVIERPPKR